MNTKLSITKSQIKMLTTKYSIDFANNTAHVWLGLKAVLGYIFKILFIRLSCRLAKKVDYRNEG